MKAVFLDRDGVINVCRVIDGKPYPPTGPDTFEFIEHAKEACQRLMSAGFLLFVATNQPDIGRGKQTLEAVESMHDLVRAELPVEKIYVCTHGSDNECTCRKPQPGMLLMAAEEYGIDLGASYMVGDRWRDIDCGATAGCTTIFIDYGYDEKLRAQPDAVVSHIGEAADWILSRSSV